MNDDTESLRSLTTRSSSRSSTSEQRISTDNSRRKRSAKCYLGIGLICIATGLSLLTFILFYDYKNTKVTVHDIYEFLEPEPTELVQKIDSIFSRKKRAYEEAFKKRFPRDQRYVNQQEILSFVPKPASLRSDISPDGEDKIQEIFDSVDENHDEVADPWEMHDWMLSVESHVQKFDLDEQWYTLGQTDMDNMTWPDFVFKHNPRGLLTTAQNRRMKRDRRRWIYADFDPKDEALSKSEFKQFLFPETSIVWVAETHEDLDSNYDGYVNEKEFLSIFEGQNQQEMSRYFSQDLDTDHDGKLDLEELSIWIDPKDFVPVKSEVIYLLEHLDLDRSKDLSMPEILNGSETFLASQMTYFGKIYGKAQVRESVFYIDDSDLA